MESENKLTSDDIIKIINKAIRNSLRKELILLIFGNYIKNRRILCLACQQYSD